MNGSRLRLVALVLLAVALAATVWVQWGRVSQSTPAQPGPATARSAPSGGRSEGAAPAAGAPTVDLAQLARARDEPGSVERDPFRVRSRAVAEPVRIEPTRPLPGLTGGGEGGSAAPAGPMPPPPIPLRLIGLVEVGGEKTKVAVLSDGRDVYYGKDGDVLDGRYRILRIGNDTVELAYVDGRGRQTLRLPGAP